MSFSTLVSDLSFKDNANDGRSRISRPPPRPANGSYAKSYASTAATSVSISGDISSQLHGGYSHPLARSWQAERQLTKVSSTFSYACSTWSDLSSPCLYTPSSSPIRTKKRLSFPPSPINTAAVLTNLSRILSLSYGKAYGLLYCLAFRLLRTSKTHWGPLQTIPKVPSYNQFNFFALASHRSSSSPMCACANTPPTATAEFCVMMGDSTIAFPLIG